MNQKQNVFQKRRNCDFCKRKVVKRVLIHDNGEPIQLQQLCKVHIQKQGKKIRLMKNDNSRVL